MKKKSDTPKQYTGDKKRIYEYLKKHNTAKTGELVEKLNTLPKQVWEMTNELEKEGVIFTIS